jgi:uncharacterized OB-fold protein
MTILLPQGREIPHAQPSSVTAEFWKGCAIGELRYQKCDECGHPNFIPTDICRNCQSLKLTWTVGSGSGVLYSWTVVWAPPTPDFVVPYAPAIIELAEGYAMISNMVDCTLEDLRPGLPVSVIFHRVSENLVLPYFRPSGGDAVGD